MSEWAKYGFPNPGFMTVQRPLEGLHKALHERMLEPIDDILATEYVPVFGAIGKNDFSHFDSALKNVVPNYVNQFDPDGACWTWEDITAKAVEGREALREHPEPILEPEWSLPWLMQRYRIINLLQIIRKELPYECEVLHDSVHTGIPSSTDEALGIVLARNTVLTSDTIAVHLHAIYGPDHGWREGSYCINVLSTRKASIGPDFEITE